MNEGLRILQVNTSDTGGGAAQVALSLHEEDRRLGHAFWLTAGYEWAQTPYTIEISKSRAIERLDEDVAFDALG